MLPASSTPSLVWTDAVARSTRSRAKSACVGRANATAHRATSAEHSPTAYVVGDKSSVRVVPAAAPWSPRSPTAVRADTFPSSAIAAPPTTDAGSRRSIRSTRTWCATARPGPACAGAPRVNPVLTREDAPCRFGAPQVSVARSSRSQWARRAPTQRCANRGCIAVAPSWSAARRYSCRRERPAIDQRRDHRQGSAPPARTAMLTAFAFRDRRSARTAPRPVAKRLPVAGMRSAEHCPALSCARASTRCARRESPEVSLERERSCARECLRRFDGDAATTADV